MLIFFCITLHRFAHSSFPYSSIVQPINWSPPVAIVLHRLDTSQPWGLAVSGEL